MKKFTRRQRKAGEIGHFYFPRLLFFVFHAWIISFSAIFHALSQYFRQIIIFQPESRVVWWVAFKKYFTPPYNYQWSKMEIYLLYLSLALLVTHCGKLCLKSDIRILQNKRKCEARQLLWKISLFLILVREIYSRYHK